MDLINSFKGTISGGFLRLKFRSKREMRGRKNCERGKEGKQMRGKQQGVKTWVI